MHPRSHAIASAALLFGAAVLLSGCNDQSVASSLPPEPPEVSIVTLKASPRAIIKELPGRIAPLRVADVRPRVSGIIVERSFEQGREVKAGDDLYQIDPSSSTRRTLAASDDTASRSPRSKSRRSRLSSFTDWVKSA